MRLLIVAVVAGLSIAPASEALESLRDKAFVQRCELQLDLAVRTAQIVAVEGEGSVRTIHMDFQSDGDLGLASLTIGDGWGKPYMASLVLELTSGGRMIRTASEPVVWLASEDSHGIRMCTEVFDLRLTASGYGSVAMVICEVQPWTS